MKWKLVVVILAVCIIALILWQHDGSAAKSDKGKLGMTMPSLEKLQWVKGGPVEFKKDKVYVIEFWATWCPPCRASIPHLTEVQKKFKDKNVTIVGISDEDTKTVKGFVEKMGDKMDYAIAVDADGSAGEGFMRAFGQNGIPTAFIVDRQGRIVWFGHPLAGMDSVLEKVAAGSFDFEKLQRTADDYEGYFRALATGDSTKAEIFGRKFLEDADGAYLSRFAWNILMVRKDKRDIALALEAAKKGSALTESKDADAMEVCALALYESARQQIDDAVKCQRKVIELSAGNANEAMMKSLKETLAKYEAAAKKLAEED